MNVLQDEVSTNVADSNTGGGEIFGLPIPAEMDAKIKAMIEDQETNAEKGMVTKVVKDKGMKDEAVVANIGGGVTVTENEIPAHLENVGKDVEKKVFGAKRTDWYLKEKDE